MMPDSARVDDAFGDRYTILMAASSLAYWSVSLDCVVLSVIVI